MKVLLVEDDTTLSAALRRGLTAAGYVVETAPDGDEGLWKATESRFDAVVLDLMLPGRSGFDVCAAMRRRGDWTPVLVLTAREGVRTETRALETGADDFLTKPFAYPVLLARLRSLIRRGSQSPAPVERSGPLHLDVDRRTAHLDGAPLDLTAREFDVLSYLVRRRGAVVSKRDILDGVWHSDFVGDPNIVEVYVRRLRTKLDPDGTTRPIETLRGAGYRWRDPDGAVARPTGGRS